MLSDVLNLVLNKVFILMKNFIYFIHLYEIWIIDTEKHLVNH